MEERLEQGTREYQGLLKDASTITEDRYPEVIEATKSEDPQEKTAAYHLLGSIMSLDLLEKDRETFLEGFDAVLRTGRDNEPEIRYAGVVILAKLMEPELLEKEEHLYMKGIAHLARAIYESDSIIAKKALDVIELGKSELEDTI
jgi:hypothetical protein